MPGNACVRERALTAYGVYRSKTRNFKLIKQWNSTAGAWSDQMHTG